MRKLGVFAIVLSFCFLILGIWFWATYSMTAAQSFSIGTKTESRSILIAYQGSAYKNELIEIMVEHFSNHEIYIEGIDVLDLKDIHPPDWTVICILNAWEIGRSPIAVEEFIENNPSMTNHVLHTTSFEGSSQLENIDGITSASILENASKDSELLISRIEHILF